MSTFELGFVDSISASATSRLNLNDGSYIRTLATGTDFGMPQLERAMFSTPLTDGGVVPAAAYSNRVITLALDLSLIADLDVAAQYLQKIAKELDRPHIPLDQPVNFLRYKAGTTNPVFFRVLRSAFSGVAWDAVQQRATVTLLAEPYAYGTKQTLAAATVNNDPAHASNGLFFDVTGVLGDVEVPLDLSITAADLLAAGDPGATTCIAVRRRGTPSAAPFLLQAETADSLGSDTTLPGNDAVMSGASSNYARTTFATQAGMGTRWSKFNFPSASVDARGMYRAFLRYRKSVLADVINVRMFYAKNGFTTTGDTYALAVQASGSSNIYWADLGLVAFPGTSDPVEDGLSGTLLAIAGGTFGIDAQRVSGSGNIDMDCVVFVPADDRLALVKWSFNSGPDKFILDSTRAMAYALNSSSQIRPEQPMPVMGGTPVVSPGATNRITFIGNVGTAGIVTDDKTDTFTVTGSYYPRYLYVRPVSS